MNYGKSRTTITLEGNVLKLPLDVTFCLLKKFHSIKFYHILYVTLPKLLTTSLPTQVHAISLFLKMENQPKIKMITDKEPKKKSNKTKKKYQTEWHK